MPRTSEHFPRMKVRGGTRRHGNRKPRDPLVAFMRSAGSFAAAAEVAQLAFLGLGQAFAQAAEFQRQYLDLMTEAANADAQEVSCG